MATNQPAGARPGESVQVHGPTLHSSAFGTGESIPAIYTCDDANISPPLSWDNLPEGTESLALLLEDPDAPQGVFTHWLLYGLPGDVRELPEGVAKTDRPEVGGAQGRNDFGNVGYDGPCPPPGSLHHYRFTILALDVPVYLDPGASRPELLAAIQGHILGEDALVGTYQRSGP